MISKKCNHLIHHQTLELALQRIITIKRQDILRTRGLSIPAGHACVFHPNPFANTASGPGLIRQQQAVKLISPL